MYTFEPFSYFMTLPKFTEIRLPKQPIFVFIKSTAKTYVCIARYSKFQNYCSIGIAVEDFSMHQQNSIQIVNDEYVTIYDSIANSVETKTTLSFQHKMPTSPIHDLLSGIPHSNFCTVRLKHLEFQVNCEPICIQKENGENNKKQNNQQNVTNTQTSANFVSYLQKFETSFSSFRKTIKSKNIFGVFKTENSYYGDFASFDQIYQYFQNPKGGISIIGGSGKDSLIKFFCDVFDIKSVDFSLNAKQKTGKSLSDRFQNCIFDMKEEDSAMRQKFTELVTSQYECLIIKDILFKKRGRELSEQENQITTQMIKLLDDNTAKEYQSKLGYKIIMIANNLDEVDPALRRSGRFGYEIVLPYLSNVLWKRWIILKLLNNAVIEQDWRTIDDYVNGIQLIEAELSQSLSPDCAKLLDEVVALTNGYTVQDLMSIASQSQSLIQFDDKPLNFKYIRPVSPSSCLAALHSCLRSARTVAHGPSELTLIERTSHELFSPSHPVSQLKYQVFGLDEQFKALDKNFSCFQSKIARELNIIPQHTLIFGPSGTGKSLLIQVLRNMHDEFTFYRVNTTHIFSQYVGESEQNLRKAFRIARESAPCVLVFENFDYIVGKTRDKEQSEVSSKVLAQVLTELDGVSQENQGVYCVGISETRPQELDQAVVRHKRLGLWVETEYLDEDQQDEVRRWAGVKIKVQKQQAAAEVMRRVMQEVGEQ